MWTGYQVYYIYPYLSSHWYLPIPVQQYVVHFIFLHFVTPFFNTEKLNSHNLYYTYLFDQPIYN